MSRFGLTVRSSVAEVEAALRDHSISLQPSVGGPACAVDGHFETYVFNDLTAESLRALCGELNKDSSASGSCTKARVMLSYLNGCGFWSVYIASLAAHVRRTCCSCHETGSFARR